MYKKVLGAHGGFPHGVFARPPSAWVSAYHDSEREQNVEAKTTAVVGGSSSSTGSLAPTTASVRPISPQRVPTRAATEADTQVAKRRVTSKRNADGGGSSSTVGKDEPQAKSRRLSTSSSSTSGLQSSSATAARDCQSGTSSESAPAKRGCQPELSRTSSTAKRACKPFKISDKWALDNTP